MQTFIRNCSTDFDFSTEVGAPRASGAPTVYLRGKNLLGILLWSMLHCRSVLKNLFGVFPPILGELLARRDKGLLGASKLSAGILLFGNFLRGAAAHCFGDLLPDFHASDFESRERKVFDVSVEGKILKNRESKENPTKCATQKTGLVFETCRFILQR